jgi:hypothetical protein
MSAIRITGQKWDNVPGVFGFHERLGVVYSRVVEGYRQEVLVAPANMMEAPAGDWWVAWPEGEYGSFFVHPDRWECAKTVLDAVYGSAES